MLLMSEDETEKKKTGKKKEISIGDSISLSDSVTVIRIRGEANKELESLPKEDRQKVLEKAIELSKIRGHPFDVQLKDVTDAKKMKEKSS